MPDKVHAACLVLVLLVMANAGAAQPASDAVNKGPTNEKPRQYDLQKLPTWTVGDQVGLAWTEQVSVGGSFASGDEIARIRWIEQMTALAEVVEVDSDERASVVRVHVPRISRQVRFYNGISDQRWKSQLTHLHFRVQRGQRATSKGMVGYYQVDPRSLHIVGDGRLTLAQLCQLRGLAIRDFMFGLTCETGLQREMFPSHRVAVGESWTTTFPLPEVLHQVSDTMLTGTALDRENRKVVLKQAVDDLLTVKSHAGGHWEDDEFGMVGGMSTETWRLDATSGRLMYWKHIFEVAQNASVLSQSLAESWQFEAKFSPGAGQASAYAPKGLTFVGWPPRGEEDNTFRRKHDFSLTPPKRMLSGLRSDDGVTRWDGRKATLRVCGDPYDETPSYTRAREILLDRLEESLVGRVDIDTEEKVFLAGRLPCIRVTMTNRKNGKDVLAVIAIGIDCYYSIIAEYPANDQELGRELKASIESFCDL